MTMLKTVRFWLVELILLAVVLPVLAIIFYSCTLFFPFYAEGGILEFSATLIVTALSGLALGRVRSAFVPLNLSFISLILPEILLLFYTLVVWLTLLIITDSDFNSGLFYTGQDWLGIFSLLTEAATEDEFFTPSLMQVATPAIPAVGILVYIVSLTHAARGRNRLTNIVGWRYIVIPVLMAVISIAGLLAWQIHDRSERKVVSVPETQLSERLALKDYSPFTANNKLTHLNEQATLAIASNWPQLNGATALYPLYASMAQMVYRNLNEESAEDYIKCWKTQGAYTALIEGRADLIFVAEPSDEQREQARNSGVGLHFYPLAREAFVFVTHKDNPVTALSDKQIRQIYSGDINNWQDVGGRDARIMPFQRPEGSGSQTIMLAAVMKQEKMRKPLETERISEMQGLIRNVASYQNSTNALGYTFRYYSTQMHHSDNLRLLAVNGIAPTAENIRSGKYPYTVTVYMVSAGRPDAQVQKIIDWFLSAQGQKMVAETGYIPLGKSTR